MSLYEYCRSNALNRVDPMGRCSLLMTIRRDPPVINGRTRDSHWTDFWGNEILDSQGGRVYTATLSGRYHSPAVGDHVPEAAGGLSEGDHLTQWNWFANKFPNLMKWAPKKLDEEAENAIKKTACKDVAVGMRFEGYEIGVGKEAKPLT